MSLVGKLLKQMFTPQPNRFMDDNRDDLSDTLWQFKDKVPQLTSIGHSEHASVDLCACLSNLQFK